MRIACVVHRFGADIAGGSEAHCRAMAEHLAATNDVTILTTTAKDHITWRNEYSSGDSKDGQLYVRRFLVARGRSLSRFREISEVVFSGGSTKAEQEEWFRENGPQSPDLLEYLKAHGASFDRVLFWSFRYYQSFFGLPLVADRAVLLPTAEEDPVIRLGILDEFFAKPAGYLFLTPEERELVERHPVPARPSAVVGVGLDPPPAAPRAALDALSIVPPYVLYLGRVDPNKGCRTLLRYFLKARQAASPAALAAPLVMAGPPNMPVPDDPAVRPLGRVDQATREALLAHASLLVVPSPYESLSMVLLEAWNHGVPALVNARCRVLKGQALRADAALYYHDDEEFARGLEYLLGRRDEAREIGRQGLAYVDREYRWPGVMRKVEQVLGEIRI